MKKKKMTQAPKRRNLVAKYARVFNRHGVHTDRTKYNRKRKHKNVELY